jgi:hypothetical protein
MADVIGQHEISDNNGTTEGFSGTATTTPANVPLSAGNVISGFMWAVDGENVEISADGGASYFLLPKKSEGFKDIKGEPTQLIIKTSSGTAGYALWIDFEEN